MKLKILAFAFALTLATNLVAQTFTTLHSFVGYPIDGANPEASLILAGSTLYGTAGSGTYGYGTVFAINTNGTGFTNVYSFTALNNNTNSDGAYPTARLMLLGNTLYGTAQGGGSLGHGTIFAVNINGTSFKNLHSFTNGIDGAGPWAGLISLGSTLYGTAEYGGNSGNGTVFRVNTDGSSFTSLHSFTALINSTIGLTNGDGAWPTAELALSGNMLYGTTFQGGTSVFGTVFEINTNGSSFKNLHSFNGNDGALPYYGLVLSGNALFGTTTDGGSAGRGTVFKMNIDGSGFTNLYSFTAASYPLFTNSDGAFPEAGLILSGNTLYGTAYNGGSSGNGTVFKLNTDGSGFVNLHTFTVTSGSNLTNSDGANPWAGLIISGNMLFGTTSKGGIAGAGTVFSLSLAPSAPTITTQPQSQTAQVGNSVNFAVTASEYPSPNYQWQLNGQNIPNATNVTLTLNSVTAANSGGYTVVVSNPYGSVTSATASLAVLDDGANGNTPAPITATPIPSKPSGAKNLVFITHGWEPEGPLADISWINDMSNAIQDKVSSDWQVVGYSWIETSEKGCLSCLF
jgi:uncharacterized repeat protein (TIGR03803 family)